MQAIQKQLDKQFQLLNRLLAVHGVHGGAKIKNNNNNRGPKNSKRGNRKPNKKGNTRARNNRRALDDKLVVQENKINTQSFFRGNSSKKRPARNSNVKTPSPNHQNQNSRYQQMRKLNQSQTKRTQVFTNSSFKPQRQRKMKRQVTPYDDVPADASLGEHIDLKSQANPNAPRYPLSTSRAVSFGKGVISDIALKRTLLYEKSVVDLTHNLASGWYAAIRKSCIRFGPSATNDKYFVDQAYRQTSGLSPIQGVSNARYDGFVTCHMLMINFLQNLLIANFNYLIQNDIQKLLTRLPQHLAFALTAAARKYVIRVRNGVTNIATRVPHFLLRNCLFYKSSDAEANPCYYDEMQSNIEMVFLPPQAWLGAQVENITATISLDEVPGLLNYLYAVQLHEQYPFTTVDEVQTKLPGLTYYTNEGQATPVTLDLSEIVSVYGYAAYPGGSTYDGCYIHDLSGLEQTKISGIFRSIFFAQIRFDAEADYALIPDEFNDRLNTNYYFDNYKMAIYFGLTGNIPNVDYMLTAQMPYGYAPDDIIQEQDATDKNKVRSTSSTSKGLSYLTAKYNSNDTRPAPYKAASRALPVFPSVNFSPHAYNLAIALAQKMQNRYYDFTAAPYPLDVISLYTIYDDDPAKQNNLSPILYNQRSYYTIFYEALLSTGVWVIQYDNRFVLPSPIIEDFKPYNSYNTWTYKGSQQSVGVQLNQESLGAGRGSLPRIEPKDNKYSGIYSNSNHWYLKNTAQYSSKLMMTDISKSTDIYYSYDGQVYSPFNFDTILDDHSKAMNEIRPYVKLNNCPEYETSLPSMHTLYVTGGQNQCYQIYTPLSMDDYTKKNVAIFLKVALLPFLQVPENVNIPMLNCTNVSENFFGNIDVLFQPKTLFNLYQYSFVASYSGDSSELDFYYSQLRKHFVGSWSDLLPMFGQAASSLLSNGGVQNLVMNMMRPKSGKTAPYANGDITGVINTILASICNMDENGAVAVNTPPPAPEKKSSSGGFWSSLGDIALKAAPMLLSLL